MLAFLILRALVHVLLARLPVVALDAVTVPIATDAAVFTRWRAVLIAGQSPARLPLFGLLVAERAKALVGAVSVAAAKVTAVPTPRQLAFVNVHLTTGTGKSRPTHTAIAPTRGAVVAALGAAREALARAPVGIEAEARLAEAEGSVVNHVAMVLAPEAVHFGTGHSTELENGNKELSVERKGREHIGRAVVRK